MFGLPVSLCTTGMPDAHGGQNRAEARGVCGVTDGCEPACAYWDRTQVLCRSSVLRYWAVSLGAGMGFLNGKESCYVSALPEVQIL